jgi:glycosidase
VERYRKEIDPNVLKDAMKWFAAHARQEDVERMIRTFAEQFPTVAVYRGKITVDEWLRTTTDGLSNREAAVEEMLMLWLANSNPAFKPFQELFEDTALKQKTVYQNATTTLPEYFATRPPLDPEIGSLLDVLRAPFTASPDSLTGQLEFIREKWAPYIGDELKRVLLAIDVVREEDIAIWLRFHPPGPDWHRHGEPGRGGEGFVGDEYVGFEDEWITDAQGRRRRRYAHDYQAPLQEYEAFSADQAWMPNVVLMAKSTYVWLEQLSKKYKWHIHRLDQVPDEELRLLAERGITGLWLIGLWERSVASRTIKRLRGGYDAVASAYSLKEYQIAEDLGGNHAYENLRDRASAFGLRLASDMVPNHMGIDSPWVIEHPDWFISRWESPFPAYSFNGPDLSADSRVEIKIDDHYYDQSDAAVAFRVRYHGDGSTRYIYHGNDGTTFAWNDTAQLDYTKAHVREHVIQVILHVARLFPIIRFDAAMVLAKRHVQRLWFPLPGAGGSIPSRAENAMSQEDFDALMPHEFWREVVDRVAVEVPGTLLLAEAFWLLESYFVRTLGMHRVYNSAFMNMLRDEENAKYRSYLKKTIEFDPDILKRYVNFMSNPDERTAIDQFGSEDKYFGVCTLLATLPGLPMFGHGQIEGYTERYGMEFKQAKLDEWPNEHLVARHMREIAPLLKRRYIFAESWNFALYDFWTGYGTVNENVFAYSNRLHGDRSIVLYNNAYVSTQGTIHVSVASMDKGSGELRPRSLTDALDIPMDDELIVVYRDAARGLEYLKRAGDFHRNGLSMELRGYQYAVLLDWRDRRHSAEWPWGELCDSLHGAGVPNADEALWKLKLKPVYQALRRAIELGRALMESKANGAPTDGAAKVQEFVSACEEFFVRAGTAVGVKHLGVAPMVADEIMTMRKNAAALAATEKELAPAAAWLVLRALKVELFDQLLMRAGLAEIFAEQGLHGEDEWRAAARVRLLLSFKDNAIRTRTFWNDSDARWLASVNEVKGKTYFNKEAFEELAAWMQMPSLLNGTLSTAKAAAELKALSTEAKEAGYELGKFLKEEIAEQATVKTVERERDIDAVEEAIEAAGEEIEDAGEEDEKPLAPSTKG